ncbi:pyruvate dehydrogenase protein X component-like [Branchiostoma floridae]|uniref:Acetyltransferase component of pyruvate dehydrogenase complex n=1 Tax=Branchiostoma floridae TaxID=7739 RepID=A0A9J7KZ70_BRAFL|nr:pyruvate dehydrogenase protein X component-like [Branchiostoma floridae]
MASSVLWRTLGRTKLLPSHTLGRPAGCTEWYRNFYRTPEVFGVAPIKLHMPALSPTMEEGTIISWLKKEGDPIAAGDPLCEIETDKATLTMDADDDGVMAKILVPGNTKNVRINELIALMVAEGEDHTQVDIPTETGTPSAAVDTPADAPVPTATEDTSSSEFSSMRHVAGGKGHVDLSPAVRYLVDSNGLDAAAIVPTGPHGRLLKGDVLKFLAGDPSSRRQEVVAPTMPSAPTPLAAPPPPPPPVTHPAVPPAAAEEDEFVDIPHTSMRRVIAKRLTQSKTTVPHAYSSIDCEMGSVLRLRKQLQGSGVKVSVNDFIIKAVGQALKTVPEVNAQWMGEAVQLLSNVDISVAVATDKGLITPIVTDVPSRGLQNISETVKELAGRARIGKLLPQEYQGGTFSVSNLGMFGISQFSAIINPPQSCIMAIGGSRVLVEPTEDGHTTKTVMTVTLCSDSRVVDDALASTFLENFKENLENPFKAALL